MAKVGLVQFAPQIGNTEGNIEEITRLIENHQRCDLYVLPELANSGYRFLNKEEAFSYAEPISSSCFLNALQTLAKKYDAYIVTGFCEIEDDKLYNSAVLIGGDGILGVYRKLHLFMDEKDIFLPGNLGLPVFDTKIGKIGLLVCFDWMFPEAWRVLAMKGAQLIAHPSNLVLPYCQGVIPSYALVNKCYIATVNRIGKERDLTFTGQSVFASPSGEVLMKGSEVNSELQVVEVDLSLSDNKSMTARNHAFDDRRSDVYGDLKI